MEKLTNEQVWELLNKDELTEEELEALGRVKVLYPRGKGINTIPDKIRYLTCQKTLTLAAITYFYTQMHNWLEFCIVCLLLYAEAL